MPVELTEILQDFVQILNFLIYLLKARVNSLDILLGLFELLKLDRVLLEDRFFDEFLNLGCWVVRHDVSELSLVCADFLIWQLEACHLHE